MIEFQAVRIAYRGGPALVFPDFEVTPGERLHIGGPSGCGKTTALHLMAGLLVPVSGRVHVFGADLAGLPARQRDRLRGRRMGLVFQRHHLIGALSVLDNLLLAARLAGRRRTPQEAVELLETVELAHRARARPEVLSGGEIQRAALARGLIHEPDLLLADEPTAGLDARRCRNTLDLLDRLCARTGTTTVIASHDDRVRDRASRTITLEEPA